MSKIAYIARNADLHEYGYRKPVSLPSLPF